MKRSNSSRKWTVLALTAALALLGAACAASPGSPQAPSAPGPAKQVEATAAELEAEKDASVSLVTEPEIEFFGAIESIGADAWTIDGQTVRLTEQTRIKDAAELHDRVRVHARVMADGALVARAIERAGDDMPGRQGTQIEFTGAVEAMGAGAWTVDGQNVAVTAHTEIEGGIEIGDLVKVHALVGAGGSLTAREIELAGEDEPAIPGVEVEFRGALETMGADAWAIGGMTFRVTAATEIEDGIEAGDFVKVHARQQGDGSLWAREIELEDAGDARAGAEIEFSGTLETMGADAWTIDGMAVHVTAQTEIEDGIDVGDFVEVHAQVEADGSLVAREIKLDESGSGDSGNDNDDNGNANDNGDDNQNGNDNGDNGNDNQNANENANDNQNGNDNGNDNGGDDNGNGDNGNDNDDGGGNDNGNGNGDDDNQNGNDNGDNGNG